MQRVLAVSIVASAWGARIRLEAVSVHCRSVALVTRVVRQCKSVHTCMKGPMLGPPM
jgi:hypothetical protein